MKSFVNNFLTTVATFKENHYTPDEFVDALGAPSMDAMLEDISPALLPWANAFMKAKVLSHLPALLPRSAAPHRWPNASGKSRAMPSPIAPRVWTAAKLCFPGGLPSPNTLDSLYHQLYRFRRSDTPRRIWPCTYSRRR